MKLNKRFLNLALVLTSVLFLVSFVSSELALQTTINSPSNSGNIVCGNSTFNANVNMSNMANLINLTFYVGSTSTANTSWTQVGENNSLNMTTLVNNSVTTIDFINSKVEDSNDYILNVTAISNNGTRTLIGNATVTGIKVDCSVPTAPSSLAPTSDDDSIVNFTGTVTGSQTTSCTLSFLGVNPGLNNYTMNHAGGTCSYNFASIPEQTYRWYVTASDRTNITDSSVQTTTISIDTPSNYLFQKGKKISIADDKTLSVVREGTFKNVPFIVWIILIVVVLISCLQYFKRKS